ncbi:hypothetical protein ACHAWF_002499, partial [Thalassiosira exigua]
MGQFDFEQLGWPQNVAISEFGKKSVSGFSSVTAPRIFLYPPTSHEMTLPLILSTVPALHFGVCVAFDSVQQADIRLATIETKWQPRITPLTSMPNFWVVGVDLGFYSAVLSGRLRPKSGQQRVDSMGMLD